jgi:predicted nuclease of predicted toxin-antitoxin system
VADQIKFYLDEHVQKAVTEGLRRRGVDVVTVQELSLQAEEDARHLERAAQDGRVVVTQDADFLRLHASGLPHRGIVYAHQQTAVSYMLRSLMLLHDVLSQDEMVNHVEFL